MQEVSRARMVRKDLQMHKTYPKHMVMDKSPVFGAHVFYSVASRGKPTAVL